MTFVKNNKISDPLKNTSVVNSEKGSKNGNFFQANFVSLRTGDFFFFSTYFCMFLYADTKDSNIIEMTGSILKVASFAQLQYTQSIVG